MSRQLYWRKGISRGHLRRNSFFLDMRRLYELPSDTFWFIRKQSSYGKWRIFPILSLELIFRFRKYGAAVIVAHTAAASTTAVKIGFPMGFSTFLKCSVELGLFSWLPNTVCACVFLSKKRLKSHNGVHSIVACKKITGPLFVNTLEKLRL